MFSHDSLEKVASPDHTTDFSVSNFFNDAYHKGLVTAVTEHPQEAISTAFIAVASVAAGIYLDRAGLVEGLLASSLRQDGKVGLSAAGERLLGKEQPVGSALASAERELAQIPPSQPSLAEFGDIAAGRHTIPELPGAPDRLNYLLKPAGERPGGSSGHLGYFGVDALWTGGLRHFCDSAAVPWFDLEKLSKGFVASPTAAPAGEIKGLGLLLRDIAERNAAVARRDLELPGLSELRARL